MKLKTIAAEIENKDSVVEVEKIYFSATYFNYCSGVKNTVINIQADSEEDVISIIDERCKRMCRIYTSPGEVDEKDSLKVIRQKTVLSISGKSEFFS